jgi:uncharacterized protein YhfF
VLSPNKYQSVIIELEENREAIIRTCKLMLKPFKTVAEELDKALKLFGKCVIK